MSLNSKYNTSSGAKHEKEINTLGYNFTPEEKIKLREVFDSRDKMIDKIEEDYKHKSISLQIKVDKAVMEVRKTEAPTNSLAQGPRPPGGGIAQPSKDAGRRAKARSLVAKNKLEALQEIRNEAKRNIHPIVKNAHNEGRQFKPKEQSNNHDNNHNH